MNRTDERRLAASLRAVSAKDLIKNSLPVVLPHLKPEELDRLQRVLDIAVINIEIENKGSMLDQQSIKGKIIHSSQHLRNNIIVAQRDRMLAQKLILNPGENAILLDHRKLLAPRALKPKTDNLDEAAYLGVVAEVYEHHGVWLVLDSSQGAMTQQMAPSDPRKWRVRLILGYKSGALVEEIKSDNGSLNQKALLSVSRLGAGYYEWVHDGPTMRTLKRAIDQVSNKIVAGRNEHLWWSQHRGEFPVVSSISDTFGRADWPSESIWEEPHKVNLRARHLINDGKLAEAGKFALLAANQAEWCGRAVHDYVAATTKGASRVVTILEIAQVCGEIAGWILTFLAVGQGVIRLLSRKGGQAILEGGIAQRQLPGGKPQLQLPAGRQTSPPTSPAGKIVPKDAPTAGYSADSMRSAPRPRGMGDSFSEALEKIRKQEALPRRGGTFYDKLGANLEIRYEKARDEYLDWLSKNPLASLEEKLAKLDRDITAHFGHLD